MLTESSTLVNANDEKAEGMLRALKECVAAEAAKATERRRLEDEEKERQRVAAEAAAKAAERRRLKDEEKERQRVAAEAAKAAERWRLEV